MKKINEFLQFNFEGLLNSYSQIFFSNNIIFALILIAVTFFDAWAGLCGVFAIVVSNFSAWAIGLNRFNVKAGVYGFNSLLVGLGIGVYYQPNFELFVLLFFASLLTLFFTVVLSGVIGKYGLPFLSLSFLIAIWLVTLSTREFESLVISERGIFTANEMYKWGGFLMVDVFNWFNNLDMHESLVIYFKSLGGIFFQYHIIAGVLIAIGLLIYSRIAFLLSLVGFFSAYLYYVFIGANIAELSYSFIGFNFILTAIALGGYFIVPSKYSFLWVILLTPLISFIITGFSHILAIYQLSILSLPFNMIVIMFLYVLKFRERAFTKPEIVYLQQNSPEKNLYSQINNLERFKNLQFFPINLPFMGEWIVTQGHNGEHTHKQDWRHAFDFEIEDEENKLFQDYGKNVEDYFCYNKTLVAPADGIVEEIIDGIEDNEIGNANIDQNWGNTIIIKHAWGLYTKLSHIKKGSFKVAVGSIVKKGDVIANCGSSGRSPQPHAHFQIQGTPYIGSKTLDYPISHYILHKNDGSYELKSYDKPIKDQKISNIQKNNSISKAFAFVPGQEISFAIEDLNAKTNYTANWEVEVDMYNNTYLICKESQAKAYFKNENNIHFFTHYEGTKHAFLYFFYLGSYKVINGFYKDLELKDNYPLNILNKNALIIVQDLFAPFYIFLHSRYKMIYKKKSEYFNESTVYLSSQTQVSIFNFKIKTIDFDFIIANNKISQITINNRKTNIIAKWKEPKKY
ncbi:MAG: urea transporter [Bacteroidota bacterium]